MNRIQPWDADQLDCEILSQPSGPEPSDEGASVTDACSMFMPLHYEPNYAYPLIVWLHGENGDERQVSQIMPLISARNYAAVGPRGTAGQAARVVATGDSTITTGFNWLQTPRHIELADRRVDRAIAHARRWLNIAPRRIFLAGWGSGGTMAFRLAMSQPRAFAGVLSLGGAFPRTLRPLAHLHDARRLNIFLACSRSSADYPEVKACADLRLFHVAGLSVCLRQYPGGDELKEQTLSDMNRWIMEQLTEPQPASVDQPSGRTPW